MTEGLTPLTSRLAAAGLSLGTRWFYWLLVAVFAVACGGFAMQIGAQRGEPARMSHAVSFLWTVRPHATVGGQGGNGDVAPDEARSLQVFTPLGPWSQSGDFATLPNVDRIELYTPATGDDLRLLAAQPNLTALSLLMTADQSAANLGQLSASSSLRRLRVLESAGYRTSEPIDWPPNLEVVDLQGAHMLPRQRLDELSRLPHLHTLAVRLAPVPSSSKLPDDVLASLQSFPNLRRLYLFEMPSLTTDLVQEAQRSLPGLRVRPSDYDNGRVQRFPGMCLVASLWVAIIGVMLSPQFVAPPSVLLPGYRAPHAAVTGTLFAAGLAIILGLMRFAGPDWLTACGLCGGAVTVCGLVAGLFRRLDPGMPGFTQPFVALPIFVFAWPVMMVFLWWSPGEFDWYLRGERPALSAVLIITGVLSFADMATWLTTLYRRTEEYGRGGCPLGLDFAGWQTWSLAASQHRKPVDWQWWLTGFDRRMNAVASQSHRDARHRRQLWIAGAMVTTRRAMAFMIAIGGLTFGGILLTAYLAGDLPRFDAKLLLGGFAYTVVMTIYLPAIFKYMRRQFYPMELLRPVSRADWVRDWFTMSAYDLAIPMGLVVAAVLTGWSLNVWPVPAVTYWLPIGVMFAGACLTLWAAELWLLTYHWAAIAVIVLLAIIACVMFGISISVNRFALEAWLQSLPGVWTLALGSVLLGCGLAYGARRRWLTWELAA